MAFYGQGAASYVGLAQKASPTGYGGTLVSAGLKTYPNLGGDVIGATAGFGARQSIATPIVLGSQTYKTVDQSTVGLSFEFVTDDAQHIDLMTAAWGKRVHGSNIDTYTISQPLYDAAADSSPTFYNHCLSWHEFITDGSANQSKWCVDDVVLTSFSLRGVNNGTITCTVGGIARKFAASTSTVTYTDSAGTLLNWAHAADTLLVGTANPPTTKMVCREFTFTLNQPHSIAAALGAATGSEMRPPVRSGPATASLAVTMDFEDHAGYDAVQALTDFAAATANNVKLTYNGGTNKTMVIQCMSSTAGAKWNEPKVNWSNTGPVTFTGTIEMNPGATADLALVLGTATA
jgi:hypothetical protein